MHLLQVFAVRSEGEQQSWHSVAATATGSPTAVGCQRLGTCPAAAWREET